MSSRVFENFLDELEARTRIEDSLKRFARAVDRQDWDLAKSFFHPDGIDNHGFYKGPVDIFLQRLKEAGPKLDHAAHFVNNVIIEFIDRKHAFVETHYLVYQRYLPNDGDKGERKISLARALDHFEERDSEWRVAQRTVVWGDMDTVRLAEPVSFPEGFIIQTRTREDPLYTMRERD